MKNIWKNYKMTILLLLGIIAGVVIGFVAKEKALVLKPLGTLFLNMLFVVIVPLIFLNVTTAISKMKSPKRLGKIMGSIVGVFLLTSIVAVLVGFFSARVVKLVSTEDSEKILASISSSDELVEEEMNLGERTVNLITVDDFSKLLTKGNIIALLVFSLAVGIAINMSGEKGEAFKNVLISANDVMGNVIKLIMYYAPIGLGSYIASFIASFDSEVGKDLVNGFLTTFVVYCVVFLIYFFIVYTIFAFIGGGKKGVKNFWKNVWPSAVTAFGTCSSAACIPVNIQTCKKIGVSDDIAETTVPLGTSFHKDGSIIGSVYKLMFLAYLFGIGFATTGEILGVLGVALLANLLVTAIPIGGGTISEMLIITMMGFPAGALPLLTVIATIIDAPATVLNVVGDDVSSMMVARIVDGKNWINGEKEPVKIDKNKKK